MSTTFRPYLPEQSLLLPPDVREWLPEGHLAHHRWSAGAVAAVAAGCAGVAAGGPPGAPPLEFAVRRSRATPAARARQGKARGPDPVDLERFRLGRPMSPIKRPI